MVYLWLFMLVTALPKAVSRCNNWCNRRGICSDPGDSGYCTCEIGYGGDDCSLMLCPRAFDPVTLGSYPGRKTIRITTGLSSGRLSGLFTFEFFGSTVEIPANLANFDEELCGETFSSLLAVGDASCQLERVNEEDGSGSFLVTFNSWSSTLYENNIYSHNGRPSVSEMICEPTPSSSDFAAGPRCTVQDAESGGPVPEYAVCSGRGHCRADTGVCSCERGFHGLACEDTADSMDVIYHLHDGPYFTGTMLKAKVLRSASPDFNLFQLARADEMGTPQDAITTVRGDGLLTHEGPIHATGSMAISARFPLRTEEQQALNALSLDGTLIPDLQKKRHSFQEASTLLHTAAGTSHQYHIRSQHDGSDVFSVAGNGKLAAQSLATLDEAFRVADGLVHARDMRVESSLSVSGAAHIEDSLTLGSGFVLNPEGMTIDANAHSHALLELKSGASGFNGGLLEIKASSQQASLIKGTVDGVTTFDLAATGDLLLNHIHLASGGLHVSSGGVLVEAGGMTVRGGLTVESGSVSFSEADLSANSVAVKRPTGSRDASALLSAESADEGFVGSLLDLSGPGLRPDGAFTFIQARSISQGGAVADDVFTVSNAGSVSASGDIATSGKLRVTKGTSLGADLTLRKVAVSAGEVITVPENAAYVEIGDDGRVAANKIQFPAIDLKSGKGVGPGRLIIVTNSDADATSGEAVIPPGTTVLFLSDGNRFVSIDALRAPMAHLRGVATLQAAADLDIGNHTLSAAALAFSTNRPVERNAILFAGPSGVIRPAAGLSYNKGVLSMPTVLASALGGDMDCQFHHLERAVLPSARLLNASIQAHELSMSQKVSGLAYFDEDGKLSVSERIKFSDAGRPIFDEMDSDLDIKGNKLTNAVVINSVLENIVNASIFNLRLTSYSSHPYEEDSIAVFQNGYLRSSRASASLSQGGHLKVVSIDKFRMQGDIAGGGHKISDVVLSGDKSSVDNIGSVTTKVLRITSLQAPPADIAKPHRLLVVNHDGDVSTLGESDRASGLRLSRVSVSSGMTVDGPLTMSEKHDLTAGNVVSLKSSIGALSVTGTMKISGDALVNLRSVPSKPSSHQLLAVDSTTGLVGSVGSAHVDGAGVLHFEHSGIATRAMKAGSLVLPSLSSVPEGVRTNEVMVADGNGIVHRASRLNIAGVTAEDMTITGAANVGKLQVNNIAHIDGGVLSVGPTNELSLIKDASLDSLKVTSIIVSDMLSIRKMKIFTESGESGVLSVDKSGAVTIGKQLLLNDIDANSARLSSVHVNQALILSGLVETNGDSRLLSVDSRGIVTASGSAQVASLQAKAMSVSGDATMASLVVDKLKHTGTSQIVLADSGGNLMASEDVSVTSLVAESAVVKNGLTANSFTISGLTASGPLSGVLTLGVGGVVGVSSSLRLSALHVDSLRSIGDAVVEGDLKLPSAGGVGILSITEGGVVKSSSALSASKASFETLDVSGISSVQGLVVSGLAGAESSILSVDEVGTLRRSETVQARYATIGSSLSTENAVVSGSLSLLRTPLSSEGADVGELLYVTADGAVGRTGSVSLDAMSVDIAHVTQKTTLGGSVHVPDLPPGMLSVDNSGVLQSVQNITINEGGSISAPSLYIRDKITLHGGLVLEGKRYYLNDVNAQFLDMTHVPLGVPRGGGALEIMTSLVGFEKVSSKSVTATGQISTPKIVITGEEGSIRAGVLIVDSTGEVSATAALEADSITTASLTVSGALSAGSIQLDSLRAAPVGSLLCSQEGGGVGPLIGNTVLKTSSIDVNGDLSVRGSLHLIGGSSGVAVTNKDGALSSTSEIAVDTILVSKEASITDLNVSGAIRLSSAAVSGKQLHGAFSVDTGSMTLTNQLSLDAVTTKDFISTGRATVDKLVLGALSKENSGFLTVASGEVSVTNDLAVQQVATTRLSVADIRPADKSGVAITDAHLSGSTVIAEGANIAKAASIETSTLSVLSGPTFFGGAVDIQGNLDVRGHVMGSGPYHDSSDSRLKTNVTEITDALEKVKAMRAVTYDYLVDEYPSKGLPSGRQIGWIAQEIKEVVPELVIADTDGFMHLSYAHAAPLIAQAVVDLSTAMVETAADSAERIKLLEKELATTRSEISELRAGLARMEAMLSKLVADKP